MPAELGERGAELRERTGVAVETAGQRCELARVLGGVAVFDSLRDLSDLPLEPRPLRLERERVRRTRP